MASSILEARDLWKSYDGVVQVLKGAHIGLLAGSGTVVWGRNGSGKTTLLNLLGCLDLPDKGSITLQGHEVTTLSPRQRTKLRLNRMGFIFQNHNLLEELTVRQNIMLPMKLSHRPESESRAEQLMERFGLEDLAERKPLEISMGESQKVAVARALSNEPTLLLADEPTASLDEEAANDLLRLLEGLRQEGRTIVMASHDSLAKALDWKLQRIQEGKLVPF